MAPRKLSKCRGASLTHRQVQDFGSPRRYVRQGLDVWALRLVGTVARERKLHQEGTQQLCMGRASPSRPGIDDQASQPLHSICLDQQTSL